MNIYYYNTDGFVLFIAQMFSMYMYGGVKAKLLYVVYI